MKTRGTFGLYEQHGLAIPETLIYLSRPELGSVRTLVRQTARWIEQFRSKDPYGNG